MAEARIADAQQVVLYWFGNIGIHIKSMLKKKSKKIKALTNNIIKLGQWHFITLPTCDIDYKFTVDKYSRPKNQNHMTTVPLLCTVLPFTLSSHSQK